MLKVLLRNPLTLFAVSIVLFVGVLALRLAIAAPLPYDLDDPSEPWRKSNSGVSKRVMPPYTALVRRGRTIECWGRSYKLGALFPASLTSQSQQLLAGPVSVRLRTGGKWTTLEGTDFHVKHASDDHIDFGGSAAVGSLRVLVSSWCEYDGLIRTDMRLVPKQSCVIEGLELVLPFKPEASIFYHVERLWGRHIYKRSPTRYGDTAAYSWHPLIWVGNHDVGLTVVTETQDGWTSAKNSIEFKRTAQSLTLTLHIISKPVRLTGEKTYTFGFQATPVKKVHPDRWGLIIGTLPGENLRAILPSPSFQPLFSYPQPGDFNALAKHVDELHKKGIKLCYYITTSATSEKSEVNKRNHADWVMSKVFLSAGKWQIGKGLIGPEACCPASSFSDFMASAVENLMDTFDVDGIYIDNPGPYRCENTRHGCGKGGKARHPYFALRDLHKRLYTIVKSRKPDGFIWEHTSQRFNSLQMSWVDIYSGGEHFREGHVYPRKQLEQMIDRTYLEITGTGQQLGAVPAFLSSLTVRTDRKDGEWSQWLLARLLPFGQMIWAQHGWMDASPAMAAAKARTNFGLGKERVRFYRPHELPNWFVVSSPKPVVACLWERKRDKGVMALLSNWNDEAVLARISHKGIASYLGPFTAKDPMTNVELPPDFIMLSIPANSFRMVTISGQSK